MTFLVERNGRELSQIISDKTNKMNKLSATFTDGHSTSSCANVGSGL